LIFETGLILIMICVAIVFMCIAGYWAQSHKINISILSIGVDYFQVLSIFSGLRVRWPFWVKEVLQILSLFNFNIDIAAVSIQSDAVSKCSCNYQ